MGLRGFICVLVSTTVVLTVACRLDAEDSPAGAILDAAGVKQGLCLVVGEEDGALTAALAGRGGLYVQGCTRDRRTVAASRGVLVEKGVADRASIQWREADCLPYADGLVNLLVVPRWGAGAATVEELVRVLAPGGTAVLGNDADPAAVAALGGQLARCGIKDLQRTPRAGWVKFIKPLDPRFGTWTQIKAGPDQSYVGDDRAVVPWREIRWIGDPRWGSLYSSYGALVTAGGRIYYKECRAAAGGNQWQLVARDAFNGFELWRVASGSPWLKSYTLTDYTLTCDESRVLLVEDNQLVARDGATGRVLRQYALKVTPKAVTSADGQLLASWRGACAALDKDSGKMLWQRACSGHPAAADGVSFVVDADQIEAVETASGTSRWKTPIEGMPAKTPFTLEVDCMHKGGVVYVVAAEKYKPFGLVAAFDAKTGAPLWRREGKFSHGVLPFADEVWCMSRDNANKVDNMHCLVLDPRTGEGKRQFQASGSVMAKCWGARATADYLMYGNGWYLKRDTGSTFGNPTTRSPCQLGQHPANGLTYFMPHHCDCHVTLRGFLALAGPGERTWFPPDHPDGEPALFDTGKRAAAAQDAPGDWPTYRKDVRRSNATAAALPASLKQLWSAKLGGGPLTQATVAYGLAYVAARRSQRVFALDAAGGEVRWTFAADGRIEYPPTLHEGICLFGTGGGSVYALDARTGAELWRLRAAPVQKFIADCGQFESAWPVEGGVMVLGGVAYFSAGRSQSQSGGLWLFAVDPAAGKIRWRKRGGSSGDMFVSDGKLPVHTAKAYGPADGESPWNWKAPPQGMLRTTRYLTTVSIADYMACVEPNLTYKKHIDLSDGRIKGENLAFNDKLSVAAWRYSPGTPGWQKKAGQYFLHAAGAATWCAEKISHQMLAIVLAADRAYAAGVPVSRDPQDKPELWVIDPADGTTVQKIVLDSPPIYDGLSAANGRLYLATEDGRLVCFGG